MLEAILKQKSTMEATWLKEKEKQLDELARRTPLRVAPAQRMLAAAFLSAERHNAMLPDAFTGRLPGEAVGPAASLPPLFTRGYSRRKQKNEDCEGHIETRKIRG